MPASMTPTGTLTEARLDRDELMFVDETDAAQPAGDAVPGLNWRVLVVDDDADVHSTTIFALKNVEMQGRPLEFLHAYTALEARAMLEREPDIAVILLDVVMERPDAGLQLVRQIREELGMHAVRIILRTGQPGYAPELDAIRGYDINDYRTKSELTRTKLYTAVAAAVRSYQQLCALDASRSGLEHILTAGTQLMTLHGVRDVAQGVLRQVATLLGQRPAGVLCVRESGQGRPDVLHVVAAAGEHCHLEGGELSPQRHALLAGAVGRALRERSCTEVDGWLALHFPGKAGRDFAACIPFARSIGDIERRLLKVFTSVVAVGLDNVELVTHLNQAAFRDQLTGLPNRTRLVELIDALLAGPQRASATLALIDLDHFAETNDALGHHFGDLLLVAVGRRLKSRLDPKLEVARIGGDIFCVLGNADAVQPAPIQALFRESFHIDGQDVQVSATLGLVRLPEHDGSGADALKDADIALKRAKSQQRAGHFYFSRSMGVEIRERVRMMHALRSGFQRGELFLAYQPQVDLANNRAFGAEALLRWRTEDGRLVGPDRFIPIAEYSGLIVDIGEWVLRQACAELVRLRAAGHREFTMSVNVSQVQFRHPHFVDMLRRALDDTRAPPEYVELEITESMAMEEPALLVEKLAQVKRTGVSIAIDDFGTGFSSLSHLQRLQVDRLKIDRTFVTEITGSARGSSIAEMVIQLGRNLGLSVIAEGVEDERQAHILRTLGCPLAQGFLFSRPLTPEALLEWLGNQALIEAA
ncbi:putative bifunctional diguanylate cyclase/phosphodiesterase [Massilia yuzhufengensis]|uniref:Diguanylate cyclase (GGDEF) domain-containing protein n=1 Tax=Massilia yuzhufengensis TaxID=1164594 RepID=A0A1I1MC28_9BURK|nr:EAL domain-containing protein [Massilia yuzhufengensis]SFC79230.1 diguanylate cyclase (GGDEF) domain-containing protein [Massilia yuzhufengensis]